MIDYVRGKIAEMTPTDITVDVNGIGFHALISIQTYSAFENNEGEVKLFLHHILREDEELFYGFASKNERELFRQIISVSGVGAATARMMLSSLSCDELTTAIISEDLNRIKSIKGIGLKTAQRIIIDLKDKVGKNSESAGTLPFAAQIDCQITQEAVTALVMLGFNKQAVTKAVSGITAANPGASIENIIKLALQKL